MEVAMTIQRNFHLPLPEDIYNDLRTESRRTKQPATRIARQAIENWLKNRRRAELHASIASYAEKHAGSDADIDEDLEEIATEHLINLQPDTRS